MLKKLIAEYERHYSAQKIRLGRLHVDGRITRDELLGRLAALDLARRALALAAKAIEGPR